jgi:hypothetical protein
MAGPSSFADVANGGSDCGVDQRTAQLRTYFLQRLSRVTELGRTTQLTPAQRRLVNHALYATYWDCAGLGSREEASTLLHLPQQRRGTD